MHAGALTLKYPPLIKYQRFEVTIFAIRNLQEVGKFNKVNTPLCFREKKNNPLYANVHTSSQATRIGVSVSSLLFNGDFNQSLSSAGTNCSHFLSSPQSVLQERTLYADSIHAFF